MNYRVYGAPKENVDAQKLHIVSYSLLLPDHDNPKNIDFNTETTVGQ